MDRRERADAEERLARRLSRWLAEPVQLEITNNISIMSSFSYRPGDYCVRLHHMFLTASSETVSALAAYIICDDDAAASAKLNKFIHSHRCSIRRPPPTSRRERLTLKTRGRVHDLAAILKEVTDEFFNFAPSEVAIGWAPAPRVRLPRHSIKLGSYSADNQVVLIHPALDQPKVPRYFVRWNVYHELLHHIFRRDLKKFRGRIHSLEFGRREQLFPDCLRAQRWQKYNLEMLLSWDPRNRREQLARAS